MLKLTALLLICLTFTATAASHVSLQSRAPRTSAGIHRLIENRDGRVSCWGVVIRLGRSRFRGVIRPEQIVISEGKHGHDLREIMSWHVGQNGRQLVIKFKPGTGDFGSGNRVEVQVDRSAFRVVDAPSPNKRFEWSIDTDVSSLLSIITKICCLV